MLKVVRLFTEQKVSILVTSRNEREIFERFRDRFQITIDISKGGVNEDIALHVQMRLQHDRRLKRWPLKIRDRMQTALPEGAQGMYLAHSCLF